MFFRRRRPAAVTFAERLETLRRQGFTVEPAAGEQVRLSKGGCAAVIEPAGEAGARFVEKPGIALGGEIARLLDRGFQKFLSTRSGGERPALAEHLTAIHRFDEELRRSLQLPSLYNESLGTVSERYHYDRLADREPEDGETPGHQ